MAQAIERREIGLEIAAKIARVNGPLEVFLPAGKSSYTSVEADLTPASTTIVISASCLMNSNSI